MNFIYDSGSSDDFVDENIAYTAEELLDSEHCSVLKPVGSLPVRIKSKTRRPEMVEDALFKDYLSPMPADYPADFERMFCMKRERDKEIVEALKGLDPSFEQRTDTVGRLDFSGLTKICGALQTIVYGDPADKADQYFLMAESTVLETVDHFTRGLTATFRAANLQVPTNEDVRRMLAASLKRVWPGKLGSIDCMS
jgi:hypothetical protein